MILITKIELKNMLNSAELDELVRIKKYIFYNEKISINQESTILRYATKSGLDPELIEEVKKTDNLLAEYIEYSFSEKPGSAAIFHRTKPHPCQVVAVQIDPQTGKELGTLYRHFTTKNYHNEILCKGVKIGDIIPQENIYEYEEITKKKFFKKKS
jgi:hypothetical protein